MPAGASASSSASFSDPVGDTTYYAPDLGATTVTVGDDETLTVDTRFVSRPPAYWGGCAYYAHIALDRRLLARDRVIAAGVTRLTARGGRPSG